MAGKMNKSVNFIYLEAVKYEYKVRITGASHNDFYITSDLWGFKYYTLRPKQ